MKNIENKKNVLESMTMATAKAALEAAVKKYNNSADVSERVRLEGEAKDLVGKYNELSMLTAYAGFMADEKPVVAIAKAYTYATISFKLNVADALVDGKAKKVKVASVECGTKTHNLFDFLEWTAKHGKKVVANGDWKAKAEAARAAINGEWKSQMESDDGYRMSKNAIKKATQAMFDALVFIEGGNGANKVIADRKIADYLIALAPKENVTFEDGKPNFKIEFMGKANWRSKAFNVLHMAVEGKTYDTVYGEPEEAVNAAAEKAEPAADAKK